MHVQSCLGNDEEADKGIIFFNQPICSFIYSVIILIITECWLCVSTVPGAVYSKMNEARGAVRTKLSEHKADASIYSSRKEILCEIEQGLVPFTLWRAKVRLTGQVCSRVMEAQDGCCKGGWAGWRRGSVPSKEPQL